MIENVEVQVGNALSFSTSHHLLRSVEDKANSLNPVLKMEDHIQFLRHYFGIFFNFF